MRGSDESHFDSKFHFRIFNKFLEVFTLIFTHLILHFEKSILLPVNASEIAG